MSAGMALLFHSKNPATDWLSNLSPHGFVLSGVKWRSVEHCYQAAKYEDASIVKIIHSASSPLAARKAGQNRSLTPRQDWDENKIRVMTEAVRAKFTQNRRLREQLLATGDEELVHLSRNDLFWGRTAEGGGENRLGLILMEVRSELRRQDG